MLKSIALYIIALAFTLTATAQQSNKPAATAPLNPTAHVGQDYSSGVTVNYVRTWDAAGPVTDANAILSADYKSVKQTTQYIDGLGRPLQTVSKQITPQAKDMVAPVEYDAFGREVYKYLPYVSAEGNGFFKLNPFSAQAAFMGNQYQSNEHIFYSQTEYEASPLNRVTKTMTPGDSWAGNSKGVSMEYLVNTANDVRIWNIASNALTYSNNDETTNIPSSPGFYNAGELYKTITKDESDNVIVEYKEKEGQVVLKKVQVGSIASDNSGHDGFLCTYYVYDDLNQLRFVIPPKAVEAIQPGWALTADVINELCFRYEYDGRKRMIAKKVPGAGWSYMVYDVRDRLVFMQDANMRGKNQWMATLYDGLNRPVMTGMIQYTGNRDNLQQTVNTQTATPSNPNTSIPVDLELKNSNTSGPKQALRSIIMLDGFQSADGGELTAEIVTGTSGADGETTVIDGVAVNKNPLPAGSIFTALTKTMYDDYNWTGTGFNPNYNGNLNDGKDETKGYNMHPVAMPSAAHTQTQGLVTGGSVRMITDPDNLAAGAWLTTVNFYDDRRRVIQVNSQTHKGTDVITNRYDFTGKVICSYLDQSVTGGTPASVHVKTNMIYDHAGRLMEVWKTINDDDSKKAIITKNQYDELGQLVNKQMGHKKDASGNYTTDVLASLDYSYNIRGWMTGINKSYLDPSADVSSQWFGMELNYDKGFDKTQLNGNIAGTKWRSQSDGVRRAYGFTYDKVNRLLGADFSQYNGSVYGEDAVVNFDMVMGDGDPLNPQLAYDANGNIQRMRQWGLKPSGSSSLIDDLRYTYYSNSNRLKNVVDFNNDEQTTLADFRTSANSPNKTQKLNYVGNPGSVDINAIIDYSYDYNGNLKKDLNKDIGTDVGSGIEYNHLNLPWQITARASGGAVKGTITYTYDAAGNKLKKIVVDNSTAGKTITTTTSYVGGLIYESKTTTPANTPNDDYTDKLQFISHEEGRARYIAESPAHFEYDYFIKDHLGNVRMLLTEELLQDTYPAATLETSNDAVAVEKQYYAIEPANVVDKSMATGISDYQNNNGVPNNNPKSNTTALSQKLYRLKAAATGGATGLGITLKVMSGDKIDILGNSYYFDNNTGGKNYSIPAEAILTGLFGNPGGAAGDKTMAAGSLNRPSVLGELANAWLKNPDRNKDKTSTKPRAYINWILFDNNFKYVTGSFERVGAANELKRHALRNIPVEKNGYLYVYASNESPVNVFFDNLQVVHTHGHILEETHYYPFGLTMTGISYRMLKPGYTENKKKFNGIEQTTELDLNQYDAFFRNFDPQTGRFWQIDPKPTPSLSLYSAMNNNPVLVGDPLGDTIRIHFSIGFLGLGGKRSVTYTNGTITNNDGSAYTGKVRGFLKNAVAGLNRLQSGGATGNGLVTGLQNNSEYVNIVKGSNQFSAVGKDGMTNVVQWDPSNNNGGPDAALNTNRPAFVGLGHELAHAYDKVSDGSVDYDTWFTTSDGKSVPNAEKFSTHIENLIRKENGIGLRAYYGLDYSSGTAVGLGQVLVPGTSQNANVDVAHGWQYNPASAAMSISGATIRTVGGSLQYSGGSLVYPPRATFTPGNFAPVPYTY